MSAETEDKRWRRVIKLFQNCTLSKQKPNSVGWLQSPKNDHHTTTAHEHQTFNAVPSSTTNTTSSTNDDTTPSPPLLHQHPRSNKPKDPIYTTQLIEANRHYSQNHRSEYESIVSSAWTPSLDKFLAQISGYVECKQYYENLSRTLSIESLSIGAIQIPVIQSHICQYQSSLESIQTDAKRTKPIFTRLLRSLVSTTCGFEPDQEVVLDNGQPLLISPDQPFRRLTIAPLKTKERCREKIKGEYDGDASMLLDVVRASVVLDDRKQLERFVKGLKVFFGKKKKKDRGASGGGGGAGGGGDGVRIVRVKNRFEKPLWNGYRDILINLSIDLDQDDGNNNKNKDSGSPGATVGYHVCELQVHLGSFLANKERSHKYYSVFRSYFQGASDLIQERVRLLEDVCRDPSATSTSFDDGGGVATMTNVEEEGGGGGGGGTTTTDTNNNNDKDQKQSELLRQHLSQTIVKTLCSSSEDRLDALGSLCSESMLGLPKIEVLVRTRRVTLAEFELAWHQQKLARAHDLTGDLENAGALYVELIPLLERLTGTESVTVARIRQGLGVVQGKRAELDESIKNLEHCRRIFEVKAKEEKEAGGGGEKEVQKEKSVMVDLGMNLHYLALQYRRKGGEVEEKGKDALATALPLYQHALEIRKETFGPDSKEVAKTLNGVAITHSLMGNNDAAVEMLKESFMIRMRKLGPDHQETALSISNISEQIVRQKGIWSQKDLEIAYCHACEAQRILKQKVSEDHFQLGNAHRLIGLCFQQRGYLDRAVEHLDLANFIYKKTLEPDHWRIINNEKSLLEVRTPVTDVSVEVLAPEGPLPASYKKRVFLFLGPPNSGKNTLVQRLIGAHPQYPMMSPDYVLWGLRHDVAPTNVLEEILLIKGKQLTTDADRGMLVQQRLFKPDCDTGCFLILGSSIESSEEIKALKDNLHQVNAQITTVVHLEKNNIEILIERNAGRWVHKPTGRRYNIFSNPPQSLVNGVPSMDEVMTLPENQLVAFMLDDETGEPLVRYQEDEQELRRSYEEYETNIVSVLRSFKDDDKVVLCGVNGNREIDLVYADVVKIIDDAVNINPE